MARPDRDTYFLQIAQVVSTRSTCLRRSVGCVLVDSRGHILSTGYNGVPAGQVHCNELTKLPVYHDDPEVTEEGGFWWFQGTPTAKFRDSFFKELDGKQCVGFRDAYQSACTGAALVSGTGLDLCQAIHAETNALIQCRDAFAIHTAYVTVSSCVPCTKQLLATSCKRIVFAEKYAHGESQERWEKAGRLWVYKPLPS